MRASSRAAIILVVAAATATGIVSDAARDVPGTTTLVYPDRTDAGDWDGTWYYISRDAKMAVWIRTTDGAPELMMQYFGMGTVEQFITDWNGHAEYKLKNRYPGVFDLTLVESDANTIKGRWEWKLERDFTRIERGDFTMYRAGYGRSFVMRFDNYERIVIEGDHEKVWRSDQVLTFRKISRRLALWDELPF